MELRPVRGTHDLLPADALKFYFIVEACRKISARFGFSEVSTPLFEFSEVFKRTLGEASDIVSKEMYTFKDRSDEELTLRPEGTAGIARLFVSSQLSQALPLKFFYHGPMFRYERPQKGRQRQFHQVGIEALGIDLPAGDVEIISLAELFLQELGLGSGLRLEINSLGDEESRRDYRDQLVSFLEERKSLLSEDSQKRLKTNPLRILDSKDPRDQETLKGAPVLSSFLNHDSKVFFDSVLQGLDDIGISYVINPQLVRGLDYYCHTIFEYKSDQLGAQDTVLAGGRYDRLIELMGGPPTAGLGWAAGLERLALLLPKEIPSPRPLALIPLGDETEAATLKLAFELRKAGYFVEVLLRGNLGKKMKRAHRLGARLAVLIGSEELQSGQASVKDLDTGTQSKLKIADLAQNLQGLL